MILPNIETFIGCESSFEEASVVLYGAPFDSTTSFRPGARFGPSAMRHESFGLETYSPYQDRDLMGIRVFDSGDLELCFGSSEMALSDIEKRAEEILNAGKLKFFSLTASDAELMNVIISQNLMTSSKHTGMT